jgi:hypothetical protein
VRSLRILRWAIITAQRRSLRQVSLPKTIFARSDGEVRNNKHEQSFECQRRNDEEIHGCNPVGMVAEKSLPPLRRRTSPSQHVFRNRRLGDIKAELEQLAVNPRRAPKRILLAHTAHEISGFLINPGPAAWIVRFPAPPGAKTHPVPANDCLRTHDRRGVADVGETPIQPDEQHPITAGKPQPFRSLSVQMRISAFNRSCDRKQSHIYPSKSLKKVAISFDHDPILFSAANPADEVFGRHR